MHTSLWNIQKYRTEKEEKTGCATAFKKDATACIECSKIYLLIVVEPGREHFAQFLSRKFARFNELHTFLGGSSQLGNHLR